jgi:hypothetical protein
MLESLNSRTFQLTTLPKDNITAYDNIELKYCLFFAIIATDKKRD